MAAYACDGTDDVTIGCQTLKNMGPDPEDTRSALGRHVFRFRCNECGRDFSVEV